MQLDFFSALWKRIKCLRRSPADDKATTTPENPLNRLPQIPSTLTSRTPLKNLLL